MARRNPAEVRNDVSMKKKCTHRFAFRFWGHILSFNLPQPPSHGAPAVKQAGAPPGRRPSQRGGCTGLTGFPCLPLSPSSSLDLTGVGDAQDHLLWELLLPVRETDAKGPYLRRRCLPVLEWLKSIPHFCSLFRNIARSHRTFWKNNAIIISDQNS